MMAVEIEHGGIQPVEFAGLINALELKRQLEAIELAGHRGNQRDGPLRGDIPIEPDLVFGGESSRFDVYLRHTNPVA